MHPLGMTEAQEHVWADAFALCFFGQEAAIYNMRPCEEVREFFRPMHR